jgi:flagellar basal body-associated protein FliL
MGRAMAQNANSETPAPAKKSRGASAIILLLSIAAAGGGWIMARSHNSATVDASPQPRVRSLLHLETFTVNLADADQRGFLRIGMDLGLGQAVKAGHEPAVAPVRDAIIEVLSAQTSQDLLTPAGKRQMKEHIRSELQSRVPDLHIEEVYFTEFLVQR